jgi:hypothetical protein
MPDSTRPLSDADQTGLARKYAGKFLVLTDERIDTAQDCWDDAFFYAMQHLDPGTFLIVRAVTGATGGDAIDGCQDELCSVEQRPYHIWTPPGGHTWTGSCLGRASVSDPADAGVKGS